MSQAHKRNKSEGARYIYQGSTSLAVVTQVRHGSRLDQIESAYACVTIYLILAT